MSRVPVTQKNFFTRAFHARSMDELSQVSRASRDPDSFFARFLEFSRVFSSFLAFLNFLELSRCSRVARAAISSAAAKPSRLEQPFRAPMRLRAGSSGHFDRPSEAERPCGCERARAGHFEHPSELGRRSSRTRANDPTDVRENCPIRCSSGDSLQRRVFSRKPLMTLLTCEVLCWGQPADTAVT